MIADFSEKPSARISAFRISRAHAMAQGSHQNIDDLGAVAEAHADLPVEPATPLPGIEGAAMVEQLREMQAIMKQLQQENQRERIHS